jgi:hypothetical protein
VIAMMTLRQVYYFLALCDEQKFTRAAKRCGIAQPSLTRAIKQLEAELGGPLFERSRKTCRLSGLGMAVQPHLAAVERAAADAKHEAAAFLAVGGPLLPIKPNPVLPFKPKENAMRKVVLGAAIAVTALFVAGTAIHMAQHATASSSLQASSIVDIYKLESTIDLKALPRHKLNYVD